MTPDDTTPPTTSREYELGRQYGRLQMFAQVQDAAVALLSEDGENPQYDRAIIELVSDVLGMPHSDRATTEAVLRGKQAERAAKIGP